MPTEVKQRKKAQKQGDETTEASSPNGKDVTTKAKTASGTSNGCCWDMRSILCFLSLAVCGALSWYVSSFFGHSRHAAVMFYFYGLWDFRVVLQQNGKFTEMQEKYKFLHGKTSRLFDMEEKVMKVHQKVSVRMNGTCEGVDSSSLTSWHNTDL